MTDPLRPATMADLKAILDDAEKHPAKQQMLATAPADALRKAGLIATPDATEFLRTLGQATFNPDAQGKVTSINDPAGTGAGEAVG